MAQLSKNTTIGGKSLLDYIYPVGTIYHTEDDSFNPSEYWGGVWEKLKGVFILGADDTNRTESGLTGGEETHTLEKSEVPNATGSITLHGAGSYGTAVQGVSGVFSADVIRAGYSYSGISGANSVGVINFNLGFGGGSHNNMPPYYTANIWKRVS